MKTIEGGNEAMLPKLEKELTIAILAVLSFVVFLGVMIGEFWF